MTTATVEICTDGYIPGACCERVNRRYNYGAWLADIERETLRAGRLSPRKAANLRRWATEQRARLDQIFPDPEAWITEAPCTCKG